MNDDILYYEIASLPIYLILIVATFSRRMSKGRSNILLLFIIYSGFAAALSDSMGNLMAIRFPLSPFKVTFVTVANYIYFATRASMNVIYTFYLFSVTRTWYRIRAMWKKMLIMVPYIATLGLLVLNTRNDGIFYVTSQTGYHRGSYVLAVYGLAAIYMLFGMWYLIHCRKSLSFSEFASLASMYALNVVGVIIQYFYSELLVECFFNSMTMLFVTLFVHRPEKQIDLNTGLPGYFAFKRELAKIKITGEKLQIIIASMRNAPDFLRYLGEKAYYDYIHVMADAIEKYAKKEKINYDLFFETPGLFYLVLEDLEYNPVQAIPDVREMVRKKSGDISAIGVKVDLRVVSVCFPDEIEETDELLRFGHDFARFSSEKMYCHADQILSKRSYQIEMRLDEILNRAIDNGKLEIIYVPIWSVRENRAVFIEARIRINDEVFGEIGSDELAEAMMARGGIMLLEEYVLNQVFAFVGEGNLSRSGLSHVVIKLSAMMMMQKSFGDSIWNLRAKYKVNPAQICFAIKESGYDKMGEGFDENIRKLSLQGYKFAVDGYGNGYSNIKHLIELPISSIRLDRSMLSGMDTEEGKAILRGTIHMLSNIHLDVVAWEVNDEKTREILCDMGCDLMQGELFREQEISR